MEPNERVRLIVKSEFMVACGLSDRGLKRSENEDAVFLDPGGKFVILADGMGGHERGAEASRSAIEIIQKFFDPQIVADELLNITPGGELPPEISSLLSLADEAINEANSTIYRRNQEADLKRFMGTTVVGLIFVDGGYMLWFHVGDSRLYRWRENTLQCLTTDHSAYLDWVKKGRQGVKPKKKHHHTGHRDETCRVGQHGMGHPGKG